MLLNISVTLFCYFGADMKIFCFLDQKTVERNAVIKIHSVKYKKCYSIKYYGVFVLTKLHPTSKYIRLAEKRKTK